MLKSHTRLAIGVTIGLGFLNLAASCDEARDRPTGLNIDVPESEVRVLEPSPNTVLFTDSVASISIEALGLLQAVEFVVLSTAPVLDTLARDRREYEPPVEFTQEDFAFVMPGIVSGSSVEIRGVAEDLLGARRVSAPVRVTVVDCDVEPARCP